MCTLYECTTCPKKTRFLWKTGCYFPKLFLNSKISCISTPFKKEISILSVIAEKLRLINICITACCSKRVVKNLDFWTHFREKIQNILLIFTIFKQNKNSGSTTKTFLTIFFFFFWGQYLFRTSSLAKINGHSRM